MLFIIAQLSRYAIVCYSLILSYQLKNTFPAIDTFVMAHICSLKRNKLYANSGVFNMRVFITFILAINAFCKMQCNRNVTSIYIFMYHTYAFFMIYCNLYLGVYFYNDLLEYNIILSQYNIILSQYNIITLNILFASLRQKLRRCHGASLPKLV